MTRYLIRRQLRRTLALASLLALPAIACTDTLLNVTDPDIIMAANSAAAAQALVNGTILRLAQAVSGVQGGGNTGEALFMFGALLTDEWRSGDTFIQRNTEDQRIWDPNNTFNHGPFRNLNRVRTQAALAIDGLRTYVPTALSDLARMFDFIAYVQVLLGEHYCNGVPLSSISGTTVIDGDPLSNDSLFKLAAANADSALSIVRGSDSTRVANFANLIKGRALLDRGDTAGARAAVTGVPRSFRYDVTHSLNVNDNQIWALNASSRRYTMGDLEGVTGLPYVTGDSIKYPIILPGGFTGKQLGDPRLPTKTGPDGIFDTAFPIKVIRQGVWGRTSNVTIASGVEARLIVAEVPVQGTKLAPLTDPGPSPKDSLRVDMLFRERGFWLFSTGHRLGDMRRLLRQYARADSTVYPHGLWFKGGPYGDAIQMVLPVEELNNTNFHGCADRNP